MLEKIEESLSPIERVHDFLSDELENLKEVILSCFNEKPGLIADVGKYFINARGKRLRPILTLLCSKMLGYQGDANIKLAAAIELIHTGTLLHDDVIDGSVTRRGGATVNSIWGNKASILSGDFFFSQAFRLMVSAGFMQSLNLLAKTLIDIIEGETKQLVNLQQKVFISEQEYFETIDAKTAKLFAAACEVTALIVNEVDDATRKLFRQFGSFLGLAYQVKDDVLDYFGDQTGKEKGVDFKEGKVTLPVITLYQRATAEERDFIKAIFADDAKKTAENFAFIVSLMQKYAIYDANLVVIKDLADQARQFLANIKIENDVKKLVFDFVDCVVYL
jgi:octaprenyl-diphosphate synthase